MWEISPEQSLNRNSTLVTLFLSNEHKNIYSFNLIRVRRILAAMIQYTLYTSRADCRYTWPVGCWPIQAGWLKVLDGQGPKGLVTAAMLPLPRVETSCSCSVASLRFGLLMISLPTQQVIIYISITAWLAGSEIWDSVTLIEDACQMKKKIFLARSICYPKDYYSTYARKTRTWRLKDSVFSLDLVKGLSKSIR